MTEWCYDLHVHTAEVSVCGHLAARDVVDLTASAGYAGIVITDHYYEFFFKRHAGKPWITQVDAYLQGYRNALRAAEARGLTVLLGAEMRFVDDPSDYLVYGIDEDFLVAHPHAYRWDIRWLARETEGTEVRIFQAHPFRRRDTVVPIGSLHGLEVLNGNPRHDSHNEEAWAAAEANDMLMISGSDIHQHEDVGRGGICVPEPLRSNSELVRTLDDNRSMRLLGFEVMQPSDR